MRPNSPLRALASLALALAVALAPAGMPDGAHRMLSVTVLMAALWVSEAMPLHWTALLGSALAIVFAGIAPEGVAAPYVSHTMWLFFGGFMLARAMEKHGLDRTIALRLIGWFGTEPGRFILGMMAATAFLSFWISNTATAAIMLPIALAAAKSSGGGDGKGVSFSKAAVIGVAFAATIGGIATIVGTPPNAITVADLAERGIEVPFFEWALKALPFVAIMVPLAWAAIVAVHRPDISTARLPPEAEGADGGARVKTLAIGSLAVLMWMSSSLHGVPDGYVAVGMAAGLCAAGVLGKEDFRKIDWATLILVGGSLSMGASIATSGLAGIIGVSFGGVVAGGGAEIAPLAVILFAVLVTSFMSNTSTAALVVPIAASLPPGLGMGMKELCMLAGISSSLNFLTPMGTPPSAMAYSSGRIGIMDMVKPGLAVTAAGVLLLAAMAWIYW